MWSSASQSKEVIPVTALYPVAGGRLAASEDAGEIIVYPNPARSELTVLSSTEWSRLTILGVDGKERINRTVYNKLEKLNVQPLSTGLYFLRIFRQDGRVVVRKVIIE